MIDRLLIAGLGSIGRRHLRLLREALPCADIRVLRHSVRFDDTPHANGCFSRLEDAVNFCPQLAVISNPAPFHLETAKALALAGAHLLVEKPLSDSAENVSELLELCSERGLVLQVGYNLRFLSTLQRFRAELQGGSIGEIYSVQHTMGQHLPDWRPETDYRQSVSAQAMLGGGVLLELSHELDMLRWVFGEISWIAGWLGRLGKLEIDVEDSAMLQLGFRGGAVAQVVMDFLRRDTTRVCTAIGSDGSLRWDAITGSLKRFSPANGEWRDILAVKVNRDDSYRAQIGALLGAIETGVPDEAAANGADGLAVMTLVDAARNSAAKGGRRMNIGGSIQ
ncbi:MULTISPECIES: Gfo/Idh/MocA family protein [Kordiimonas]|jgi:predicted dehydrogenase|uniref:Gfo/Idh/MocA family protein n=1 Tax=Kordiimonas TaxID=288021 RepID=UPI00257A4497|nr:Gfo/Idh/MocA family oxidoreductase [Kordiimonas sp. UBA4487]